MKRRTVFLTVGVVLAISVLALAGAGSALAAPPPPGGGPGGGFGPGGMMGGYGSGPGGMMGGYGGGMMGGRYGGNTPNQGNPIDLNKAVENVQAYVKAYGSQDLTVDEVMEFQYNYYAIVKEKSTGMGAFELLVNKYTGYVSPEMGPNMMWNAKYGMMYGGFGGMMRGMLGWVRGLFGADGRGNAGAMTVTADQAKAAAESWLKQYQPGSTTEAPDQFYGYYTVHVLSGGKVTGMLSVNGYSGQVWYHTWHGDFVQLKELGQ